MLYKNRNKMTHTVTVLRRKTAKAIVMAAYNADLSGSMAPDGLSMQGANIRVAAVHDVKKGEFVIELTSSVWELPTLRSIVDSVYVAIERERGK